MMSTILQSPQWLSLHGLFVVLGLLTYVLTTHSLQQRRAPSAAISWVLAITLIPYVGLPLYLLFGTRKFVHSGSRAVGKIRSEEHTSELQSLRHLVCRLL